MAGSFAAMKRPPERRDAAGSSAKSKPGSALEQDSLVAFDSESDALLRASIRRRNSPLIGFAVLTAIVAGAAGVYFLRSQSDSPVSAAPRVAVPSAPPAVRTSDVVIDSRPAGAEVLVD